MRESNVSSAETSSAADHADPPPGPAPPAARRRSLLQMPFCADWLADGAWEQLIADVDWSSDGWRLAQTLAAIARPRMASEIAAVNDEPLTAREREVLQLVAEGIPNKQIAQRLRISEHTVKFHVSAIMAKLNAASRTEAVTTAARRGLLLL